MIRVLANTFNFEFDPVVIQNGRKLHFSAVGSNKYIGRARPHLRVISLSFGQKLQHQCEKMWSSVGKKSCWRSILPPRICFFSVAWSIFNESRFQISHRTWTWSQLFSPKQPSGGQYDNYEQYFWQIYAPILAWGIKRMCFENLEMRHSFMDLLTMVWCFIWHDSPVQYDLQYWFFL